MAIVLNGTTGITAPDIDVTAQATDITTTGDITAVDATLSGGVYLGGTGSANKLDDYEEGTFTPTLQSGTFSLTHASYTKVGRQVTIYIVIGNISDYTTGTSFYISGMPFTADTGKCVGTSMWQYGSSSGHHVVYMTLVQQFTCMQPTKQFNYLKWILEADTGEAKWH